MKPKAIAAIKYLSAVFVLTSCVSNSEQSQSHHEQGLAYLQQLRQIRDRSIQSDMTLAAMRRLVKSNQSRLIGLTEQQIREIMGQASWECNASAAGKVAGCFQDGDIIYSFYDYCNDCLGGGLELSLTFNGNHICTRGRFLISE